MAWVKAKWIDALFFAFNVRFPRRDRSTDGTIGDRAHQTSASGHNPDDTPGSKSERQDADSIPEVRAADVDVDLRDPDGYTMEHVVQAILRTPRDRDRFIYIIFNRRIWRKASGWREERYGGDDPHTSHPHFSGDPAYDEDGAPFTSILNLGRAEKMDANAWELFTAITNGTTPAGYTAETKGYAGNAPHQVREGSLYTNKQLAAKIDGLAKDLATVIAAVNALSQTVAKLAERPVPAEGRTMKELEQAAFEGAQRAERE